MSGIAGEDYGLVVVNDFVNEESTIQDWEVVVHSAKSSDDVVVNPTDNDKVIKVYPKPVVTGLTLN